MVLAADRKMDWKLCRAAVGKKAKLAGPDDLLRLTGCLPGACPPFGGLWQIPTYACESLREQGPVTSCAGQRISHRR